MDLHVTVVGAPPSRTSRREIVVDTATLRSGAELGDRLEAAGWHPPFTIDGVPLAALNHQDGLRNGAVIVAGASPTRRASSVAHLALVTHSGPDAGQVFPLVRGTYTIGRAAAEIVIADPALSRAHARLTVTEDSITVEDLDSVNGTFVDGESITRAPLTVSRALRLGSTLCRIALLDDAAWAGSSTQDVLHPLPVAPEHPRKPSRILVLTAFLPLVLGVVLALTTGMWFFLAFSALSAVTGLVPLLTYRRASRVFGLAVLKMAEEDRRRRIDAAPDPGHVGMDAARGVHGVHGVDGVRRETSSPAPILLRLGTADQAANLTVRSPDGSFSSPVLRGVPFLVPIPDASPPNGVEGLILFGEEDSVRALVRSLLLQLAHPSAGAPSIICWGSTRETPVAARFLPNVRLTHSPEALAALVKQVRRCVVLDFSGDLRSGIDDSFVISVLPAEGPHVRSRSASTTAIIVADGVTARAHLRGVSHDVVLDTVSAKTFDRSARAFAAGAGGSPPTSSALPPGVSRSVPLPVEASFWSKETTVEGLCDTAREAWSTADPLHPVAMLGVSGQGLLSVDLVTDGPHLLIAGTTGSGKSELLRTLVLSLAVQQPPSHLSLLLVDYKGGSGLGELAALPHCVGSMSDLSTESTARAFVSLRAELRRRELLCAQHGAGDLDHLRQLDPGACPPRLVVVIDEFRALLDDVPSVAPDLLKIASLGRSLGLHLVLATQKAQGAVPPDMRANITSTILLRVRTSLESQDLLGTGSAAEIPVRLPGRAFLRRGNETPVEFQVASCSTPAPSDDSPGWLDLETYLAGRTHRVQEVVPPTDARRTRAGESARMSPNLLRNAVDAVATAARRDDAALPDHPVLPPLPSSVTADLCAVVSGAHHDPVLSAPPERIDRAHSPAGVTIGIADLPEHQTQRALQWTPDHHSHLAFIGLPGSGGSEALGAVVGALPATNPDVHLYLLDGDGSLASLRGGTEGRGIGAHVGAHVDPHEGRRAARVLERLAGLPPTRQDGPRIVLAMTGWGRWFALFREMRGGRAEEHLLAIIRDGEVNGVSVLILGDRELTASRFFSLIPNRVFLPLGAHQETTMTWPRMPVLHEVPGRGFAQGRILGPWGDAVCQLVLSTPDHRNARPPRQPPFTVRPLPAALPWSSIAPLLVTGNTGGTGITRGSGGSTDYATRDRAHDGHHPGTLAGARTGEVILGVHGDDLDPYCIDVQPGEVFLVLGHHGSGRTNVARLVDAGLRGAAGPRRVLVPPRRATAPGVETYWRALAGGGSGAGEDAVIIVDDADRLPVDVQRILSELVHRGAGAVLSARPSPSLVSRVPLALQARASGHGLVLSPRSSADGDLFGVRLDVDGPSPAGRGIAVEPEGTFEVQTALAPSDGSAHVAAGEPRPGGAGATAFVRAR